MNVNQHIITSSYTNGEFMMFLGFQRLNNDSFTGTFHEKSKNKLTTENEKILLIPELFGSSNL